LLIAGVSTLKSTSHNAEQSTDGDYIVLVPLLIYNILSASLVSKVFFEPKPDTCWRFFYWGINIARVIMLAVTVALTFTLLPKSQIMYTFWVITSIFFFFIKEIYTYQVIFLAPFKKWSNICRKSTSQITAVG
jgi:hypothetical protein